MSINCVRSLLEKASARIPEKVAIIGDNYSLTYEELLQKVNQVAHYLSELELPKGSRIGIYSHKGVEQIISILAIMSTDYIFVPISRLLKPEQVQHIINDCGIGCLITDKSKLKKIEDIDYQGTDYHL